MTIRGMRDTALGRSLLAFFVVQIVVAAFQLTKPRAARFGWQMYAGLSEPLVFTAVFPDGERPVVLTDYLAMRRADTNIIGVLPSAVCRRESRAVVVRFRIPGQRHDSEVRCAR